VGRLHHRWLPLYGLLISGLTYLQIILCDTIVFLLYFLVAVLQKSDHKLIDNFQCPNKPQLV